VSGNGKAPVDRARRACGGSAAVEFLVAAMVVLPLALAILEFAQLAVARHALNHGAFEAARAAALEGGRPEVLRQQLARAMAPLFAPAAPASGTPSDEQGLQGVLRAAAEFLRPDLASITVEASGDGAIAQSMPDPQVLVVRVRYCRELLFPWHAALWPARTRLPAFDLGCRARGRLPIEAVAAVHVSVAAAPGPTAGLQAPSLPPASSGASAARAGLRAASTISRSSGRSMSIPAVLIGTRVTRSTWRRNSSWAPRSPRNCCSSLNAQRGKIAGTPTEPA
jgi:hypothetical protein